jgi:hypothetical protein
VTSFAQGLSSVVREMMGLILKLACCCGGDVRSRETMLRAVVDELQLTLRESME